MGFWASRFGFGVLGFEVWVWAFGLRGFRLVFWASRFGFRVLGFEVWVWGIWVHDRVLGVGLRLVESSLGVGCWAWVLVQWVGCWCTGSGVGLLGRVFV